MSTHRIELELSTGVYERLRQMVDSGEYTSESEAIEAALVYNLVPDTPAHAQNSVEAWLAAELCSAYDDDVANPGAGLSSAELEAYLSQQRLQPQKAG